jgi:hypothetical protein
MIAHDSAEGKGNKLNKSRLRRIFAGRDINTLLCVREYGDLRPGQKVGRATHLLPRRRTAASGGR